MKPNLTKTMKKQFNELPLPTGYPKPPEGWYFIGLDRDLPRMTGQFIICSNDSTDWSYVSDWLMQPVLAYGNQAIAAPASQVRRLSTQERNKRRKGKQAAPATPAAISKFKEVPLPEGIQQPPKGYVYVGKRVKGLTDYEVYFRDGWTKSGKVDCVGPSSGLDMHYAAHESLVDRLTRPVTPLTAVTPASPPKLYLVNGIRVEGTEEAYKKAEEHARQNPDAEIYVWELRSTLKAQITINRTDV